MIHLTENGDIDFSKITETLIEIDCQIDRINLQEYTAQNQTELNYWCEIRNYLESTQETINSAIPNSYDIIHANPMESNNFEFLGNLIN